MATQQAVLEGWLRFNDEDVATNRDGRLSPRQRRGMFWSAAWRLVVGPSVAVVAALIAATSLETAIAVLIALIALCVGLQLSWSGFAFLADASSNAVAFVTAPLGTHVVRGRSTTYFADVGPIHKTIGRRAYVGLQDTVGGTYHLYYAPGARSLLSMEAASAREPLPAHPFGADSAHVWDRLRWSWILLTVGAFGALLGAHQLASAHPAVPVKVSGTVENYVEETTYGRGAHTDRSLYLTGDDNVYTPEAEDAYTPEAPAYYSLIGKEVILFVNQGTTDVIALSDGDTTYAGDWYSHPENERTYMVINGVLITVLGAFFLALGLVFMVRDRRRAEEVPGRAALYVPPTVHSARNVWPAAGVLALVFGLFAAVILLAFAGTK